MIPIDVLVLSELKVLIAIGFPIVKVIKDLLIIRVGVSLIRDIIFLQLNLYLVKSR